MSSVHFLFASHVCKKKFHIQYSAVQYSVFRGLSNVICYYTKYRIIYAKQAKCLFSEIKLDEALPNQQLKIHG